MMTNASNRDGVASSAPAEHPRWWDEAELSLKCSLPHISRAFDELKDSLTMEVLCRGHHAEN
jgi:hypothetical protein